MLVVSVNPPAHFGGLGRRGVIAVAIMVVVMVAVAAVRRGHC